MDTSKEIHGTRVLVCGEQGALVASEHDLGDLFGTAWAEDAALVALPVARLHPDFFRLSTGIAGGIAQKFANYRLRLAIIGNISSWSEKSAPLRDFVREANRGQALWFLDDLAALDERLAPAGNR